MTRWRSARTPRDFDAKLLGLSEAPATKGGRRRYRCAQSEPPCTQTERHATATGKVCPSAVGAPARRHNRIVRTKARSARQTIQRVELNRGQGKSDHCPGGHRSSVDLSCETTHPDSTAWSHDRARRTNDAAAAIGYPYGHLFRLLILEVGLCRLRRGFHPYRNGKVLPRSRRNVEMLLSTFPKIRR